MRPEGKSAFRGVRVRVETGSINVEGSLKDGSGLTGAGE